MNSRLFNIPAIMMVVLTISVGSFIYNTSQATITDSLTTISTQEIDAFNSLFIMYEGNQTGTNVKNLIARLITNASTYKDEQEKIPYVYVDKPNETAMEEIEITISSSSDENAINEYIQELIDLRNKIASKNEYYIEMSYQKNGLIDYINISFDSSNIIYEIKHR